MWVPAAYSWGGYPPAPWLPGLISPLTISSKPGTGSSQEVFTGRSEWKEMIENWRPRVAAWSQIVFSGWTHNENSPVVLSCSLRRVSSDSNLNGLGRCRLWASVKNWAQIPRSHVKLDAIVHICNDTTLQWDRKKYQQLALHASRQITGHPASNRAEGLDWNQGWPLTTCLTHISIHTAILLLFYFNPEAYHEVYMT